MDDKNFARLFFVIMAAFVIWWILKQKNVTVQNAAPASEDETPYPLNENPIDAAYAASPSSYGLQPIDVNVNVADQGFSYLSNAYIPLFGFVGVAQGMMY